MKSFLKILLPALILAAACSGREGGTEAWRSTLHLPTHMAKFGDTYFLVDCGHNRVLYSRSPDAPISDWNTLEENMGGPHSIASDGRFFVVDDTGKHRLRIYERSGRNFRLVQTVLGVGARPHRVIYDKTARAFYVMASNSQTISKLSVSGDGLKLLYARQLPFLRGRYTRSVSIIKGHMFFVSGPDAITETEYLDDSYKVLRVYPVPKEVGWMNDLVLIGGTYWLTSSTPKSFLFKTTDLGRLAHSRITDLRPEFGLTANPYYFSHIDGRIVLTQIGRQQNSVVSFKLDRRGNPCGLKERWKSGPISEESLRVAVSQPR